MREPFSVIFRDLVLSPEDLRGPLLSEAPRPSSCYYQSFSSALHLPLPLAEQTNASVPAVPVPVPALAGSSLPCPRGPRLLLQSSVDVPSTQHSKHRLRLVPRCTGWTQEHGIARRLAGTDSPSPAPPNEKMSVQDTAINHSLSPPLAVLAGRNQQRPLLPC
ncbi:uncharacterized protein LOC129209706 isoform X2 [Grus americana]|uniref:uncharacterized protein LOC129209706 isoform X2 n=1 Tax=Grus americana TaxID=9117 RepID=UPI002408836F|nr:uncharacterized protein LOC129209706 isoform X2 [Grus americana]